MTTTNNTNPALTISYLYEPQEQVLLPTSFSEITGDQEVAKENFQAIMKEFPAWLESRNRWIDRYRSIRESLKGNSNRDYILALILDKDLPSDWKYNEAHEDIGIGCAYSFKLIRMICDGFFSTVPYLFIDGYAFCEPKKIFEVTIPLELV